MSAILPPIFFQGGSPNRLLYFPARTFLTARNRFRPNFQGWGLDENLKLKSPPPRGASAHARTCPSTGCGIATTNQIQSSSNPAHPLFMPSYELRLMDWVKDEPGLIAVGYEECIGAKEASSYGLRLR